MTNKGYQKPSEAELQAWTQLNAQVCGATGGTARN